MAAPDPGNIVTRHVRAGVAGRAAGIANENAAKTGEIAGERNVKTAANPVHKGSVVQAIQKGRARASQWKLHAIEREMQFVDKSSCRRGGQARREVLIVLLGRNASEARKKIFMLIVRIRVLVEDVAHRQHRLLGEVMVDAPGNAVRIRHRVAWEVQNTASVVKGRAVGVGIERKDLLHRWIWRQVEDVFRRTLV